MTDLARFEALVPLDHGLSVIVTRRADTTPHTSVVNAGVLRHPVTGERSVAFVAAGGTRKLVHLRADPTIAVVVRAGWQWTAVEGQAQLLGPDDFHPEVDDERLRSVLAAAANLMQAPRRRRGHYVYRRAGRPCGRCGTLIRSWPQGDDARMAYWCPACQEGTEPRGA